MRQQGFSLVELLMGLTIVGIVLHLVSPAFAAVTESNLREQAAESLYSGIRTARTEAIARHQSVMMLLVAPLSMPSPICWFTFVISFSKLARATA